MSRVAICTDSSALLASDVVAESGITVVPIPVTVDGERFEESTASVDDFYALLERGAKATTSQPSPAAFLAAYAGAAADGAEQILSVHLDRRASGTLNSAELAAQDARIPVTVVDSQAVSYGVGVCVREAAGILAAGGSIRKAAEAVTTLGAGLRNVFVAPGAPAGRIPDVAAWSVLEFSDGTIVPVELCEELDAAIEAMAQRVAADGGPVRVAVGHAGASTEDAADRLARLLSELPHVENVERYRVGLAVGAHTGPLSFGLFWWPARASRPS